MMLCTAPEVVPWPPMSGVCVCRGGGASRQGGVAWLAMPPCTPWEWEWPLAPLWRGGGGEGGGTYAGIVQ